MKKPVSVLPDDPGYSLSMAAQRAARHVVQLFECPIGKRPALFGNALLVRHLGRVFLVSAGHVLNALPQDARPLYYFANTGKGFARLRTRGIAFTEGNAETESKDVLDLAAGELLSELPNIDLKEPIESSRIGSIGLPDAGNVYVATGFPSSRSKVDPSKQRLTTTLSGFRTTLAPVAARDTLQAHPVLQLVLSLDIKRMDFPDGSVRAIADPAGMSGSPIWLLQEDELFCAGILIEHHRLKKLLVATNIVVGLQLIQSIAVRFPTDLANPGLQF
jgi:hypothetical protein